MQIKAFFNTLSTGVECGQNAKKTEGTINSLTNISLAIDSEKEEVSIVIAGPSGVWFGAGFNATGMCDGNPR